MKMKTKLTNKIIIPCVAVLAAALCAGILLYNTLRSEGQSASIYKDGKLTQTVDLNNKNSYTIDIGTNTILVQDGMVRMKSATCPDKLCVKQGQIHNKGEAIICLPNKVVVEINGIREDIDALSE